MDDAIDHQVTCGGVDSRRRERPALLHKWTVRLIAAAIAAMLVLSAAGCGGDDSLDTVSDAAESATEDVGLSLNTGEVAADRADGAMEAAVEQEARADAPSSAPQLQAEPALGGGGTNAQVDPASLGREIIYTADMTVAVDDVTAAGSEAARIVGDQGGLLFGQESFASGSAPDGGARGATSRLTFRVRPADFQKVLGGLSALGEVRDQVVSTEDVTGRVVDLESRITTSETSVERIRELLGTASDVETVTALEQQLLERETTLEVLRGQLRQVRDQVDLATIHLTLTEALANPAISLSTTWYVGDDEGAACPGGNGAVDEGDDVTVCFEVFNTGDAPVATIDLVDTVLDIDQDALTVVFGDPAGALQPGQSLLWSYETTVERAQRLRTRVSATPVNNDGDAVRTRTIQANSEPGIPVTDDDSLPGFTDAVAGGFGVLKGLGQVLVLAVGALLPFIWVVPVVWLIRRYARPRHANVSAETSPAVTRPPRPAPEGGTPPPPTAVPGDDFPDTEQS